jgi:hypothetical protein
VVLPRREAVETSEVDSSGYERDADYLTTRVTAHRPSTVMFDGDTSLTASSDTNLGRDDYFDGVGVPIAVPP